MLSYDVAGRAAWSTPIGALLVVLVSALAPSPLAAQVEAAHVAAELARLTADGAEAEAGLFDQARAALDVAAAAEGAARERALAIADAALSLVRARRERADAERARAAAEARRAELAERAERARARHAAATADRERGP